LSHQYNNNPICFACAKENGLFETIPPSPVVKSAPKGHISIKPQIPYINVLAPRKKYSSTSDTSKIVGQVFVGYLLVAWVMLSIIIILAGLVSGQKNTKNRTIPLSTNYWIDRGKALATDDRQLRAFNLMAKAAEKKNDPAAQYGLGCYFYSHSESASDFNLAAQWLQKSAEQGYAAAQYNLALLYQQGAGVEKNTILAKRLFEKAALQKHLAARKNLQQINYNSN